MLVCYDITWSNARTKKISYDDKIWKLWLVFTFEMQTIINEVLSAFVNT